MGGNYVFTRRATQIFVFNPAGQLIAVKDLSYDFEMVQRDTGKYFEGLFRRPGKAWTLGYEIEVAAGLAR